MKILVVVDMQNDFIDGALGTPEAQAIVPNVIQKIKGARARLNPIIFTADTHTNDYLNTLEGSKLPVPHCIRGTEGWMIHTDILKSGTGNDMIVYKDTFGSNFLCRYIHSNYSRRTIECIELVGLCTDICVISNAMLLKAQFPDIPIVVDSSCCAGVTPESHQRALEAMKTCHIDVI